MEEIDARLVEAEHVKATWTPVQDLIIDSLSEQIDELKVTAAILLRPLDKNFFLWLSSFPSTHKIVEWVVKMPVRFVRCGQTSWICQGELRRNPSGN